MADMRIESLKPGFGARITGIDLREQLTDDDVRAIVAIADEYAVLVFPDQPVSQAQQVAFTSRFGPLDYGPQKVLKTIQVRLQESALSDISNVDVSGEVAARSHTQSIMNIGNMLWHSDSSYSHYPFRYSVLSCQVPAAWGGQTEYADLRSAYDALDPHFKEIIADKVSSFFSLHGRDQLGVESSDAIRNLYPPVKWPLVRTHPSSGRKVLWVGTALYEIEGMPVHEARMLAHILIEHATQRERVYTHDWKPNDVLMWDNRATLHRGRWFDLDSRREMRRAGTTDNVGSIDAPAEKPDYSGFVAA